MLRRLVSSRAIARSPTRLAVQPMRTPPHAARGFVSTVSGARAASSRQPASATLRAAEFASRAADVSPAALANELLDLLRSIDAPLLDATERGSPAKQKRLAVHSLGPTRDRDEALAVAKTYITSDTTRRTGSTGPFTIAATSGAPGTGKSHLLDEVADRGQAWVIESGYAKRFLPLKVTFNSETSLPMPRRGLAVRTILTYFCGNVSAGQFKRYGKQLAKQLPEEIEFENIVAAIAADFGAVHGVERDEIKVALLIDEIRKAEDDGGVHQTYEQAAAMLGPKCGLFVSSLQQTDLLKDFGSTWSGRRVQLMPLPVLDTIEWYEERGISNEVVQRLVILTGGHARTMENLIESTPEPIDEWNPRWFAGAIQSVSDGVAELVVGAGSADLEPWLFSALASEKLNLEHKNWDGNTLVEAVQNGVLMNGTHALVKSLVPLVSLFGWRKFATAENKIRQLNLLQVLFMKRSPALFEELFALHTSVLLELFRTEHLRGHDPIRLFTDADVGGLALFRCAKFIRTPAGDDVEELSFKAKSGRLLTIKDNMWKPTSEWTVEEQENCLVPMADDVVDDLLPFDVVHTTSVNQAGFDTLMLVENVKGERHVVLFELKQTDDADGSIKTDKLVDKINMTSEGLEQLLKSPLIAEAGITRHEQVTLCLVTLGALARNVESRLRRASKDSSFNVVLLDRDALKVHFGPSLAPAIAIYDNQL